MTLSKSRASSGLSVPICIWEADKFPDRSQAPRQRPLGLPSNLARQTGLTYAGVPILDPPTSGYGERGYTQDPSSMAALPVRTARTAEWEDRLTEQVTHQRRLSRKFLTWSQPRGKGRRGLSQAELREVHAQGPGHQVSHSPSPRMIYLYAQSSNQSSPDSSPGGDSLRTGLSPWDLLCFPRGVTHREGVQEHACWRQGIRTEEREREKRKRWVFLPGRFCAG